MFPAGLSRSPIRGLATWCASARGVVSSFRSTRTAIYSLRVSLYGVDAKSTAAVTRNPKSFERVVRNAQDFLLLRNERRAELKFGFNFVILPGCAAQVVALAELIAALNQHTGGRGVDFLTLREDYSAAPGAGIPPDERPELARLFEWLEARRRERDLDGLRIDYGYALHALRRGASTQALEMADHRAMRQRGYPQISVVVDLLGDVYLYREAGFLDRPGAKRYAIGRVSPGRPFEQVLRDFIDSRRAIALLDGDTRYFDIFDHVVTLLLNQADADAAFGIPFDEGPVRARVRSAKHESRVTLAHPTLS
jgi:dTDP-4-amino-4,6-dideoxy-D-glucose ammonia-lyase